MRLIKRTVPKKLSGVFLGVFIFMTVFLISGCSLEGSIAQPPLSSSGTTYPVDTVFQDLYNFLGGEERVGPAISQVYFEEDLRYQHFETVLMVHDPNAPQEQRTKLVPLGHQMNINDPPVPPPSDSNVKYVNGHIIYREFLPAFEQLGGVRIVGKPLTEIRYNHERGRLEQYFENLGFYRLDMDPPNTVRLMAYGAYLCDFKCRGYRSEVMAVPDTKNMLPEPFATAVARLGGKAFTGKMLYGPELNEDGQRFIIFENAVLSINTNNSSPVFPLPLPKMVGIKTQNPVDRINHEGLAFFVIEGNEGFNIPLVFTDYLAKHGGLDFSGRPITELFTPLEKVYRQCFENMCVDYYSQAPKDEQIRLAPLGTIYYQRYFKSATKKPELTLKVSESTPIITSSQSQQIIVQVFDGNHPIANIKPTLTITLPDGEQKSVTLPSTNANGQTQMNINPVHAPNSTIIPYIVCVDDLTTEPLCEQDSYLIWGNP